MKLTVAERLSLLENLPREGSSLNIRTMRKLREALDFSEDAAHFDLRLVPQENGGAAYQWSLAVNQEADISLGESETAALVASLKEMEKAGRLSDREAGFPAGHVPFSVYEKFVPEPEKEP